MKEGVSKHLIELVESLGKFELKKGFLKLNWLSALVKISLPLTDQKREISTLLTSIY